MISAPPLVSCSTLHLSVVLLFLFATLFAVLATDAYWREDEKLWPALATVAAILSLVAFVLQMKGQCATSTLVVLL